MIVIGLTGYAQSGKDSAAACLVEQGFQRLAFADALRDSVYALNPLVEMPLPDAPNHWARVKDLVDWIGWDRAKVEYPEIRQLLQRMGTEVGRTIFGDSFWIDRVTSQMERDGRYVITDVRFDNECAAVHALGGWVYRIHRPGVGAANGHASETTIDGLDHDGIIDNCGTLNELKARMLTLPGTVGALS